MVGLRSLRSIAGVTLIVALLSANAPAAIDPPLGGPASAAGEWDWPLEGARLDRVFEPPPDRYGPGHRGIDLRPGIGTGPRVAVRAPSDGVVAFSGQVGGRGILTIDHGSGLVTTFEPVESDRVPGAKVARGDAVAILTLGGHAAAGALHFGVRLDGEYINPMLLLGGVPRAVLLPCC